MARPRFDSPRFRLIRRGARFYVRWWTDGAWQRVSTSTDDPAQAARYLAQFSAGAAQAPAPAVPTVGHILDAYLADRKPRVAAYATLEAAAKALRRHLGDLEPAHLGTTQSRLYLRRRRTEGHMVGPADAKRRKTTADGTVARELVTLRAALRWAVQAGWIATAPHIETPKAAPARDRWLTREEAAKLLAACKAPHLRLFAALALYTAARSQAILDLTWPQVDLAAGIITYGAGTGNKRRSVVPIAAALAPYLADARRAATVARVIEFGGDPVASIKTGFRAACRRAGLLGVTPHILRHTAATWMAVAGVPMAQIARFLGNSESMVEKVYAKHSPDYLRAAAAALSG